MKKNCTLIALLFFIVSVPAYAHDPEGMAVIAVSMVGVALSLLIAGILFVTGRLAVAKIAL